MHNKSKFYIISLGPGDPELITIKALKALQDCDVIFLPVRNKNNDCTGAVSYNILNKIINTHTIFNVDNIYQKLKAVYSPMNYSQDAWNQQVNEIIKSFQSFNTIGYVTLGDAGLYSSAYYLLEIIEKNYPQVFKNTIIIPGITSISSCSALAKKPLALGNSSLEITPAHAENISKTKVYMRLHKGDNISHLTSDNLYIFENIGLDNEKYGNEIPQTINNYLTVMIDFANKQNKE